MAGFGQDIQRVVMKSDHTLYCLDLELVCLPSFCHA